MATDGAGKYTATAGDDGVVLIHEMRGSSSGIAAVPAGGPSPANANRPSMTVVATLRGHEGSPVIRVAWAPPRVEGHPLATSAIDGTVHVWKDASAAAAALGSPQQQPPAAGGPSAPGVPEWQIAYTRRFPAPVVAMAWSPEEFGVALACACADGKVYVVDNSARQTWGVASFDAHTATGCTGVSWAPYLTPGALFAMPLIGQGAGGGPPPAPAPRLVTCGGEPVARIWRYSRAEQMWLHEGDLPDSPASSQRDVAWAPNVGLPFSYVAAAGDDRFVTVWLQDAPEGMWRAVALPPFPDAVVRVSWSLVGTFLLVACANNSASIWKEDAHGGWAQVTAVETTAAAVAPPPPPPSGPAMQRQTSAQPQQFQTYPQQQQFGGPSPPPPMHQQQQQQQGGFSNNSMNTAPSMGGMPPMPMPPAGNASFGGAGGNVPMMASPHNAAQQFQQHSPPPPQQYQTSMYTR